MISKLNKKASGDMYISPWMFLNWVIIGASIVLGVIMFYSAFADTRELEAGVMGNVILNCLSDKFIFSAISSPNFDIYNQCNLNKNLFDKSDIYYFKISIAEITSGSEVFNLRSNENMETDCELQVKEKKVFKNLAQCSYDSSYVVDENTKNQYLIKIITASKQK